MKTIQFKNLRYSDLSDHNVLFTSHSMIQLYERDLRIIWNDKGFFLSCGFAALADDDYSNDEPDGNSPQHSDHHSYNHDHAVGGLWPRIVVFLSCGEQNGRFINLDHKLISEDSASAANPLFWIQLIVVRPKINISLWIISHRSTEATFCNPYIKTQGLLFNVRMPSIKIRLLSTTRATDDQRLMTLRPRNFTQTAAGYPPAQGICNLPFMG